MASTWLHPNSSQMPAGHPTKAGWHLVKFSTGQVGVYNTINDFLGVPTGWDFQGTEPAGASVTGIYYLGNDPNSVAHTYGIHSGAIQKWLGGGNSKAGAWLEQKIGDYLDVASLGTESKPALFTPTNTGSGIQSVTASGPGSNLTGDAQTSYLPGTTGITNALSNLSLSSIFGSLQTWKGIGLVLAGAAVLVFAALEIKNLS